ncbi:MAG: flagellar basal body rod protein FlgB [Myxococcota bacterium]
MSQFFGPIDDLQSALDYHLERHNVLASNVANIDTPGFRPLELVRVSVDNDDNQLSVQRTHEDHLRLPGRQQAGEAVLEEQVVQPGADDNAVSLEREMSKVAANDLRYDAASRIVRLHIGMLRYAATDTQK